VERGGGKEAEEYEEEDKKKPIRYRGHLKKVMVFL
jgi:dTDP-4-dehydrorhamnose reductase